MIIDHYPKRKWHSKIGIKDGKNVLMEILIMKPQNGNGHNGGSTIVETMSTLLKHTDTIKELSQIRVNDNYSFNVVVEEFSKLSEDERGYILDFCGKHRWVHPPLNM